MKNDELRKINCIWPKGKCISIKTMQGSASVVAVTKFMKLIYQLCTQPKVFSRFSHKGLLLFSNLNRCFSEKGFGTNDELIVQTNACFVILVQFYYFEGVKRLNNWTN